MATVFLVVEECDPREPLSIILRRVRKYLECGVALVWVVDRDDRSIVVYRLGRGFDYFDERDEIKGEDIPQELRCRVAEFFALPGQQA